jgi:hypothetical protein
MELDDLKQALTRLDKRFEAQAATDLAHARREVRNRAADGLRPMARGQIGLIVSGAITALIGVATWHGSTFSDGGSAGHFGPFVSGIILHVYGVAMIMFGVIVRVLIAGIDWAAPVVSIQRRLAKVRRAYVLAGIVIGLTWCVLWMPAMVAGLFLLFGTDIVAPSPVTWLWLGASGLGLMAAVGLFYLWASATGRTAITNAFSRAFTGEPLGRAEADLAAISAFERD